MTITFIGLGAMGRPMAANLSRRFPTRVWNRTTAIARQHASDFSTTAIEHLSGARGSDVVLSILPTSAEVEQLVDEVAAVLEPGALWIDTTSGDPVSSRRIADKLGTKRIRFIDAPVTGGTNGAEAATLTIMVGGASEDVEDARPILESMGSKIIHIGDVGAGHAVKAMNNAMLAANLLAASECLLALDRFGIDLRKAFEVLNGGSGRSFASTDLLPSRLIDGNWPVTFKLALHEKDVRIARAIAESLGVESPLIEATARLMKEALADLVPEADYVEATRYVAHLNRTEWN